MVRNHFKGKQFQRDVIIVAVGYYLRYNLSYREVQEILYDRGIHVSHTTIYRWVQEYGKLLYQLWKRKKKQSFYSQKMDETYIKIKGMEAIRGIYKKSRKEGTLFGFSVCIEINGLLEMPV
ncbi:IS6 family transposase [Enterococcus sp. BWB1-3]|nr:IS6 family transposase [Enterococcus sp. BWT-B8]MBL1228690.1 IS6 family transposase [Enterococcus sp. BWB1-3]MCB5952763.1 hypothetical protein [Enterococcus sp. BWT-B8]